MERRAEIRLASRLPVSAAEVWARVTTPAGINDELRPLLRMTVPSGAGRLDPDSLASGPVGRSWILLFGLLPFDYDEIALEWVQPGRGFLERSTMFSQRLWEHERAVEPVPEGGCRLTDRVAWEPRLPLPGASLRPLIAALLRHRHRRLRKRFGTL